MKNKLVALMLGLALLLALSVTASATENKIFTLTDCETDLTYKVSVKDNFVTISRDNNTLSSVYLNSIDACTVLGGVFTFYSVDNLNSVLSIYSYDVAQDSVNSFALNTKAASNPYFFTADKKGFIYFVSEDNTKKLCIHNGVSKQEIELKSKITELLCVDSESIIVITTDSTYLYSGNLLKTLLGYPLSVPVYYTGNSILTDTNGREYKFENGTLTENQIFTTQAEIYLTEPQPESEYYYAEAGVTVGKIKKAFADFEITKTAKADGTIIKSGKLGTGATVTFKTGECITVIISGELTGEGNINSRDLTALLNHLSEKELLKGTALLAADVNKDNEITTKDALLIAKMY